MFCQIFYFKKYIESDDLLLAIFGSGRISSQGTQSSKSRKILFNDKTSNQSVAPEETEKEKVADKSDVSNILNKDSNKKTQKHSNKSSHKKVTNETNIETAYRTRGRSGNKFVTYKTIGEIGKSTSEAKMDASNEVVSQDGSRDLFSSQISQGSLLDEQIDITLQVL